MGTYSRGGLNRGEEAKSRIYGIVDHVNIAFHFFLDFQKAFDTINILFEKMVNYGIRGPAINWSKSYLQGHSQVVTIDTEASNIFIW